MKICIAMHPCMDIGGIIDHTEFLTAGLTTLGHQVHICELRWNNKQLSDQHKEGPWDKMFTGIDVAQGKGWNFKKENLLSYKGPMKPRAIAFLNQFDMVIWTVPVPGKGKNTVRNMDWPDLFDLDPHVKQVAFVHDGNVRRGGVHLLAADDRLDAIACVHHAALGGASIFETPRALILNPQLEPMRDVHKWDYKQPGFVNMQTFKGWKHVPELIEAIAYLPPKQDSFEFREVAGKGIEYRYLTSKDKPKEAYFHADGTGFWAGALANGMTHHDYWNKATVETYLKEARILVDPSWSKAYSKLGGHYNRVGVDAMIRGCVVVARQMGMGSDLFKPGQHYVEIPEEASPYEYAETIRWAWNMSESEADRYRAECCRVLPRFDMVRVAQDLIDLAHGNHPEMLKGEHDPFYMNKAEDLCFNHFGVMI